MTDTANAIPVKQVRVRISRKHKAVQQMLWTLKGWEGKYWERGTYKTTYTGKFDHEEIGWLFGPFAVQRHRCGWKITHLLSGKNFGVQSCAANFKEAKWLAECLLQLPECNWFVEDPLAGMDQAVKNQVWNMYANGEGVNWEGLR